MSSGAARRAGRPQDCGQETLQTILVVAFVLLPVLVAIFTFGSLIHLYIAEQAAAASGARAAGADGGFGVVEQARVVGELDANGIDAAGCTVIPSATSVALGDPISVTVRCAQRVGIPFLLQDNVRLTSTFVAYGEVNH